MDGDQVFQLGPTQLSAKWLILMIGMIIALFITEKIARKKGWEKDKWSDLIVIVGITFIVVYKFGWVIFDVRSVLENPASLLFTTGDTVTVVMAIGATVLMFIYSMRKNKYPLFDIFDFSWILYTVILLVYNLFIMDYGKSTNFFLAVAIDGESTYLYHPINWYQAGWLGLMLIIRYRMKGAFQEIQLMYAYIVLGMGLLFISIFNFSVDMYIGFTIEQWTDILFILIGGIGLLKKYNY